MLRPHDPKVMDLSMETSDEYTMAYSSAKPYMIGTYWYHEIVSQIWYRVHGCHARNWILVGPPQRNIILYCGGIGGRYSEIEWNWRKLMKLRVLTRLHDFETVVFWGISWEGELCGLDDAVKADLGKAKRTGHTMNLQAMRTLAAWVVSKAGLERNH